MSFARVPSKEEKLDVAGELKLRNETLQGQ